MNQTLYIRDKSDWKVWDTARAVAGVKRLSLSSLVFTALHEYLVRHGHLTGVDQ